MTSILPWTRVFLRPLLIGAALAVLARFLFVQVFAIPSGSMMPTLQAGDQILVTPYRLLWREREPHRGEIVVFRRFDDPSGFYVKRVIGVPGDHLAIRDGQVYIDGRPLAEPYLPSYKTDGNTAPDIVPAESYFVMGDHRDDSIDSRCWGFVPRSTIVGRVRLVLWSAAGESSYQSANATTADGQSRSTRPRLRWGRLLTPVR